ncbi:MAG: sulfatase-like hydrolase/transferase [Planctomycetota bacterium]
MALLAIVAAVVGVGLWRSWGGRGWGASTSALAGAAKDFNVLLITLDTTRADCLGCYGHPVVRTPHIDALAKEGVRFTQCTTAAPITLPSHSSIMTATYPFVHRARNNGRYLADEGNVTLAEMLRPAGYATGAEVGAYVLAAIWGLNQGFDSYRSEKVGGGERREPERPAKEQSVPADDVCDRALEWLGQHGSQRFFLWVHFFDPHMPWTPPERFARQYTDPKLGGYYGEIAFVDEQVGRLLGELGRMGLAERTLVVLTADHGEGLNQHRELTHTYFVYDSTMRVPLMMRCPGRIPADRVVEAQVRTADIAPTVLALLGLPAKADAQGASLLPLVEGRTKDPELGAYGESVSAHEAFGYARLWTYRAGGWKYIHAPTPELYDLGGDPGEENNLADRYPQRVKALRKRLEAVIAAGLALGAQVDRVEQLDAAAVSKLAALGYAGGYVPAESRDELELFHEFAGPDPKEHIDQYAQYMEARAWAGAQQPEKAAALLKQLTAAEPDAPEFHALLAEQLRLLGQWQDAAAEYAVLLELQPDSGLAHYQMGKVLGELGRSEESVKHLRIAAAAMPEYADAQAYLALGLAQSGQAKEAERSFQRALEIEPGHEDAVVGLGDLLHARGRSEEALAVLRQGLDHRPERVQLANNLAWFLATLPEAELRDGAEAVRVAEGICAQAGDAGPELLDTLAAAYACAGRFEEAVRTARRALDLSLSAKNSALAEEIRGRLALFEAGRPYRQGK